MHIELSVSGQRLRREMGPGIVGGSRYYLTAHVAFAGHDWDGCQVWLCIDKDGAQNAYLLDADGCVTADRGINLPFGQYTMSLLGLRDNVRITTNVEALFVQKSGADGGDPLPEIPQTAAEQIALMAQEAVDTARSVREDADAGDFNGAPGNNGVSAEHQWNGSVLTITSASGTSSADLRGPQGPEGKQGPQGQAGKDAPQDAVRYGVQALDEAQKETARGNIGAASAGEVSRVKGDLDEMFDKEYYISPNILSNDLLTSGKYINDVGELANGASSMNASDFISCVYGDMFKLFCYLVPQSAYTQLVFWSVAFYNESKVFISSDYSHSLKNISVSDESARYIRVTVNNDFSNEETYKDFMLLKNYVGSVNKYIPNEKYLSSLVSPKLIVNRENLDDDMKTSIPLTTIISSPNLINPNTCLPYTILDGSGNVKDNRVDFFTTDFIKVTGKTLYISRYVDGDIPYTRTIKSIYQIALYDENKNFLSMPHSGSTVQSITIENADAVYCKLAIRGDETGTMHNFAQLKFDDESLVWYPHYQRISINDFEYKPYSNKKVGFIGDSITYAVDRWVDMFVGYTDCIKLWNTAVVGATMRNTSSTVLDGNPIYDRESGQSINNTICNQVQKLLNGTYETPDVIIISAGTNDMALPIDADIESAFTSDNQYVDVNTVDLKTFSGAMRWIYQKLKGLFPNTDIIWCTPIQSSPRNRPYHTNSYQIGCKEKGDIIKEIGARLGCEVWDTMACGIYAGLEADSHKYLSDGLHENILGAELHAKYNASQFIRKYSVIN